MSFEDHFINNIDFKRKNREELSPVLETAYSKAREEVLDNPEYSIQEKDFTKIYTREAIMRDLAYVKDRESSFDNQETWEKNTAKIASVLEAIVLMQSEMSEWLGNAQTLHSSRYDDYKNGTDMIAEWSSPQEGTRVLALGVDVTFGADQIANKLRIIKRTIDSDTLSSIRYFKDAHGDFMGTRNNVAQSVIGVSQPLVTELAGLWVNNDQKALGMHPVQSLFLHQIETQLQTMLTYAKFKARNNAIRSFEQSLATIRSVKASKTPIPFDALRKDPVAESIALQTREIFR